MISIIKLNYGIKQPTNAYEYGIGSAKSCVFGGYVTLSPSSYALVNVWVNNILTTLILHLPCLEMMTFAWYVDPNGIQNKNIVKYPYPAGIMITEASNIANTHFMFSSWILQFTAVDRRTLVNQQSLHSSLVHLEVILPT
jgi:hypothetical protein